MGDPARPTPSERACRGAVATLALWTLCSHTTVAFGGSLLHLLGLFAVAGAACLAFRFVRGAPDELPATTSQRGDASANETALRLGAIALAAVLVLAYRGDAISVVAFWWGSLALLGFAALHAVRTPLAAPHAPAVGRGAEAALWGLGAVAVLVTLVAHRPDQDDAFYVNLAVAAADDPRAPILAFDTLHGIAGLPLHFSLYRIHSWEMLGGALSFATSLPALGVFHFVLASLGALAIPLAFAQLFRRLLPDAWLGAVFALCVVVLAVGETHFWYGNYAFVRIWQGKGIFLFVLAPLVAAFAIDFVRAPSRRRWARLAAACIASVGCTGTAVWAAPVAALVAGASAVTLDRRGLAPLAGVALACAYCLFAGLGFRGDAQGQLADLVEASAPGVELAAAFAKHLGEGPIQTFGLFAVLAAWACLPAGLGRRYAAVAPLAVTFVLLDPYTEAFVSRNLVGPVFARVMWALPVPLLMALVLATPLQLVGERQLLGFRIFAAGLVAFAVALPGYSALDYRNTYTRVEAPGLKVRPNGYRWARELNRAVPPGAAVVAPPHVNTWIPTFHRHASPLVVRIYLNPHRDRIGRTNLRDRHAMVSYTAGERLLPNTREIFREGLARYDVRAAVLKQSDLIEEARAVLAEAGFVLTTQAPRHEMWVRP